MAQLDPNQTKVNGVVYNISQIFYNGTITSILSDNHPCWQYGTKCTIQTCSILVGTYTYLPSVPGNAFFAAVFGLLFAIQLPLGIFYRTWGIGACMVLGMGLEVTAYVTRVTIHDNDFSRNLFIIYLYAITLGPTFISAAIYLCLSRIVVVYDEGVSSFKPRTYAIPFMIGDFLALSLQGAGGGMLQVVETQAVGLRVLIAGLGFQVLSLTVFALACADFAWRVSRSSRPFNPAFDALRRFRKWTGFLVSLAIGTAAIYIRSVYRIVELQAGFHSAVANNEVLFMCLEGLVVALGSINLTICHPGLVFGKQWRQADFSLKGKTPQQHMARASNPNVGTLTGKSATQEATSC